MSDLAYRESSPKLNEIAQGVVLSLLVPYCPRVGFHISKARGAHPSKENLLRGEIDSLYLLALTHVYLTVYLPSTDTYFL